MKNYRNYTQKVTPRRFLYHVSKEENRHLIKKYGLLPKGNYNTIEGVKPALFAHDCKKGKPSVNWYPFIMDYIDSCFIETHLYNQFENFDFMRLIKLQGYDIWCIDTKNISNQWYFDEVMFREFEIFFTERPPSFLVSFEGVPIEALSLF